MTPNRREVDRTPAVVADGWRLFAMLSALYFAQGLPSGLIAKALPALLREQGVSLSVIGFTSGLALPWALKFAWAPFIDRYGSRKRWLLVLNCLTMALMLLVASRDFAAWVAALPLLLAVLFCMNLVSATQDIATDGYAVSTSSPSGAGSATASRSSATRSAWWWAAARCCGSPPAMAGSRVTPASPA